MAVLRWRYRASRSKIGVTMTSGEIPGSRAILFISHERTSTWDVSSLRRGGGHPLARIGVAYAIAASLSDAGDGSVTDSSISIGRNNWGGDGQIRSYSLSKNAYFGSLLVYSSYPDAKCGRSSTDTNSTSYVSKRVSCTTMAVSPNADGVRIRICQNKPIVWDPCGGWSNTHWR